MRTRTPTGLAAARSAAAGGAKERDGDEQFDGAAAGASAVAAAAVEHTEELSQLPARTCPRAADLKEAQHTQAAAEMTKTMKTLDAAAAAVPVHSDTAP